MIDTILSVLALIFGIFVLAVISTEKTAEEMVAERQYTREK